METPGSHTPISNQLSDAELEINENIERALTAPKFVPSTATLGTSAGYAILREDLEHRSARNRALAQEQDLAYTMAARMNLHDQALRQDQDARDAEIALGQLPELLKIMSPEEAISHQVMENPLMAINKTYVDGTNQFKQFNESPHDKFMRENGEALAELTTKNGIQDMETKIRQGEWTVDTLDQMGEVYKAGVEAAEIRANDDVAKAHMERYRRKAEFKVMVDNNGLYRSAMQKAGLGERQPGADMYNIVKDVDDLVGFFEERGMPFIDPAHFVTTQIPNEFEVSFMSSPDLQAALELSTGLERGELQGKLAVLGDPMKAIEADGEGPMADAAAREIVEAEGLLARGGRMFKQKYRNEIVNEQNMVTLAKEKKELADAYLKTMSNIDRTLDTEKPTANTLSLAGKQASDLIMSLAMSKPGGVPLSTGLNLEAKKQLLGLDVNTDLTETEIDMQGELEGKWHAIPTPPEPDTSSNALKNPKIFYRELQDWMTTSINQIYAEKLPGDTGGGLEGFDQNFAPSK